MTTLERPVKRETATMYRGRPLLIKLHPRFMEISEKGRRDSVTLDYEAAYETALKIRYQTTQNRVVNK